MTRDEMLAIIEGVLGETREVNGGELESVLTIYNHRGLAVLIANALDAYEQVQPDPEPCDWDGESYCVEQACIAPATHRRLLGFHPDIGDPIVELVCCRHASEPMTD